MEDASKRTTHIKKRKTKSNTAIQLLKHKVFFDKEIKETRQQKVLNECIFFLTIVLTTRWS